jgi:S-adenosylmethionine:tRNA ribosyltransferase-isomerase
MDIEALHYDLPESLVAAVPSENRAFSRLLVLQRGTGEIIHTVFSNLGDFLSAGDLLVVNDTRVFPARLRGVKESGGSAEVLLLEQFPPQRHLWIGMVHAAKKPQIGSRIIFSRDLRAHVIGDLGRGRFGLEFEHGGDFDDQLQALGEPPLPLYIRRRREAAGIDWERYQTVYASHCGAVAAPTAGLHFTPELFERLRLQGIRRAAITLHVGAGTFQPVRHQEIESHRMEGERYIVSDRTAEEINMTKQTGGRVIAVGSTSTRALEWVALQKGKVVADQGITRLFIRPGDAFRVVDALLTNFHPPASTPLLLVAAFAGPDLTRRAYAEAIRLRYRFYSYGDAMLIL